MISLLLDKGDGKSSYIMSGIYGLFSICSNDILVGLPIISVISPPYIPYCVISTAIQNVIFNPIVFVILEKGKFEDQAAQLARNPPAPKASRGDELLEGGEILAEAALDKALERMAKVRKMNSYKMIWNVISTPAVWVSTLAVVYNLTLADVCIAFYGHPMPPFLKNVLTLMGNPFTCCALMSIGHASYGKIAGLRGHSLRLPLALCLVKTFFSPLIFFAIGNLLLVDESSSSSRKESLDFLFIIGSIPTGPAVYVFATSYDAIPSTIAGALCMCYLVAAPIMYLTSASIIATTTSEGSQNLRDEIYNLPMQVGWATILGAMWFLIAVRAWVRMRAHQLAWLRPLAVAQLGMVVVTIAARFVSEVGTTACVMYSFILFCKWVIHCYVTVIAVDLMLISTYRTRPSTLGVAMRHLVSLFLPMVYAVVMALILEPYDPTASDINNFRIWRYGYPQWIFEIFATLALLVIQVGCVLRVERNEVSANALPHDLSEEATDPSETSSFVKEDRSQYAILEDRSQHAILGHGAAEAMATVATSPTHTRTTSQSGIKRRDLDRKRGIERKISWTTPLCDAGVTIGGDNSAPFLDRSVPPQVVSPGSPLASPRSTPLSSSKGNSASETRATGTTLRPFLGLGDKSRLVFLVLYNVCIGAFGAIQLIYKWITYPSSLSNSDGVLVQVTFVEQTLLYAQGISLFIAFGIQDPVLGLVRQAWVSCTSGPCCTYMAQFTRSFAGSFRFTMSQTGTFHSGSEAGSSLARSSLRDSRGVYDDTSRRGLKKNRFTSKSQPADLSKLRPETQGVDEASLDHDRGFMHLQ